MGDYCNRNERFKMTQEWYNRCRNELKDSHCTHRNSCVNTSYLYRKVEVEKMAKEVDLKKIISNLAKLGVSATMTKSRLEMLKALAPPAHDPHIQSHYWIIVKRLLAATGTRWFLGRHTSSFYSKEKLHRKIFRWSFLIHYSSSSLLNMYVRWWNFMLNTSPIASIFPISELPP
jgi:hypothetical protein